ncbi:MAG: hypothetical protein QM638_12125 [Nocardioides sp.]|uniref:hypothetical protein n=1 Tax=Nocardioides sp. TaxID=35761 RepID=UPI0039E6DACD
MTDAQPRRRHGALRDEVLGILLHADEPLTARRLTDALAGPGGPGSPGGPSGPGPALTTVLTVLDRLHRAGEVTKARAETGELVFEIAPQPPDAVAHDMLAALLRSGDRTGALLSFAGNLNAEDRAVLRHLVYRDGAGRGGPSEDTGGSS